MELTLREFSACIGAREPGSDLVWVTPEPSVLFSVPGYPPDPDTIVGDSKQVHHGSLMFWASELEHIRY